MYSETADLDAVLARDVLDERGLAGDFDEFFAGVAVLVEGADVAGGHGAGEGDGDGVLNQTVRSMDRVGGSRDSGDGGRAE